MAESPPPPPDWRDGGYPLVAWHSGREWEALATFQDAPNISIAELKTLMEEFADWKLAKSGSKKERLDALEQEFLRRQGLAMETMRASCTKAFGSSSECLSTSPPPRIRTPCWAALDPVSRSSRSLGGQSWDPQIKRGDFVLVHISAH